jgi:hypothetical protein
MFSFFLCDLVALQYAFLWRALLAFDSNQRKFLRQEHFEILKDIFILKMLLVALNYYITLFLIFDFIQFISTKEPCALISNWNHRG